LLIVIGIVFLVLYLVSSPSVMPFKQVSFIRADVFDMVTLFSFTAALLLFPEHSGFLQIYNGYTACERFMDY